MSQRGSDDGQDGNGRGDDGQDGNGRGDDGQDGNGRGDAPRTRIARLVQFLTFVAMLDLLALALATQFVPPDRLTLALTVGPMLVVSPVLAYWFVYERGGAVGR